MEYDSAVLFGPMPPVWMLAWFPEGSCSSPFSQVSNSTATLDVIPPYPIPTPGVPTTVCDMFWITNTIPSAPGAVLAPTSRSAGPGLSMRIAKRVSKPPATGCLVVDQAAPAVHVSAGVRRIPQSGSSVVEPRSTSPLPEQIGGGCDEVTTRVPLALARSAVAVMVTVP